MSDTSLAKGAGGGSSGIVPIIIIAGLLGAGFLLLTMLSSGARDRQLTNSQIGVAALGYWLNDQGVDARNSHRRLNPSLSELSLRVLPLYDMNLSSWSGTAETREERIEDVNQRDTYLENYNSKLTELPSVVLLPKWSGALTETGIAHAQSLVPEERYTRLFNQMGLNGIRLLRAGPVFSKQQVVGDFEVALFHAQRFDPRSLPSNCKTLVRYGSDALAISCEREGQGHPFYVLADPDVMNNHGLAVAQNAGFATALLKDLVDSSDGAVYIDNSPHLLTTAERASERQDYDRGADELSRFFMYPFSLFWAVLLIVLAVLFWRGSRRFGPIRGTDEGARERSKRAAITAKARLLRLSGNDGHMVADFVRLQLQDLGARSFGGALGQGNEARFMALLARRDPELAQEFSAITDMLINDGADMAPSLLDRHLTTYQTLLKKVVSHYEPV